MATTTDRGFAPATARGASRAKKPVNGGWWKTLKLSIGLFAAMLALMAARMAGGHDPLLAANAVPAGRPAKTIQQKLIVRRRVIVEQVPPAHAAATSGGSQAATYVAVSPGSGSYAPIGSRPSAAPQVYAPAPPPTTSAS